METREILRVSSALILIFVALVCFFKLAELRLNNDSSIKADEIVAKNNMLLSNGYSYCLVSNNKYVTLYSSKIIGVGDVLKGDDIDSHNRFIYFDMGVLYFIILIAIIAIISNRGKK